MFSTLDAWNMLDGTRVLDLFAGSGALGLEAASRGAREVVFVEKHAPAAQVAQANIKRVTRHLDEERAPLMRVLRTTALTFLDAVPEAPWDVVFVDPPYDIAASTLYEVVAKIASQLHEDGLIMVERGTRDGSPPLPESLRVLREKRYGETTLWWLERADRT